MGTPVDATPTADAKETPLFGGVGVSTTAGASAYFNDLWER
jgi:hypothetical protein